MGKAKSSAVFDHFELKTDVTTKKKTAKCKVEECSSTLSSHHATNLKTHLRTVHPDVFKRVQEVDEEIQSRPEKRKASEKPTENKQSKQSLLTDYAESHSTAVKSVRINIDSHSFERACVSMVTNGGCPFRLMNDPGFRVITDPIKKALNIKMDRKIIKEKVMAVYEEEARRLVNLLKDKPIYLKLDLATRLDRSFLGVNIQFEHEGKLQLFTLKVLDIGNKSTDAATLTEIIGGILEKFKIAKTNILSITTDNGSNVLKIAELLSTNQEPPSDSEDDDSEESLPRTDTETHLDEDSEDDAHDDLDIQEDDNEQFVEAEEGIIAFSGEITSTRCAAHTLDLAADDVESIKKVKNAIMRLKPVVKKLRTKNFRQLPMRRYNKKPLLNNATRWGSTFDMVKCALAMKDGIVEWGVSNPQLKVPSSVWNTLEMYAQIMEPVRLAIRSLQQDALTPGDFYKIWLKMKHSLQKMPENEISKKMLERVDVREAKLIENNALMIAGIYCDPRFTSILPEEYIKVARKSITNLILKLQRSNEGQVVEIQQTEGDDDEDDDDFEIYLRAQERTRNVSAEASNDLLPEIEKNLNNLEKLPRIKKSTNEPFSCLQWWQEHKDWLISNAATILSCLPATQVSVERLFSALAIILTEKRNRLSADTIDAVLFLRLNCSEK